MNLSELKLPHEPTTADEVRALARKVRRRAAQRFIVLPTLVHAARAKPTERDWLDTSLPQSEVWEGLSCSKIRTAVARVSGVPWKQFTTASRLKKYMQLRCAFYTLCRKHTKASFPTIGRWAGGRDHSSVQAAFRSQQMHHPRTLDVITKAEALFLQWRDKG